MNRFFFSAIAVAAFGRMGKVRRGGERGEGWEEGEENWNRILASGQAECVVTNTHTDTHAQGAHSQSLTLHR